MAGDSLRDAMVPSEFARQLERELAEAREIVEMQKETMRQMREQYGIGERNVMRELRQQRNTLAEALGEIMTCAHPSGNSDRQRFYRDIAKQALAAAKGGTP
jgi:glutamyl-tRNA reductase